MNLNIGPGADSKVDNFGHLGGLITGIFAGIAITEFQDHTARKNDRIPDRFTEEQYKERSSCRNSWFCNFIGVQLLILWLLSLLVIFFVFIDTDDLRQEDLDNPS